MCMDYFLAHTTALQLIRYVRSGSDLVLASTDVREVASLKGSRVKLASSCIPELCGVLRANKHNPLHLLVPTARDRRRCAGITCTVRAKPWGAQPYLLVRPIDEEVGSPLLPKDTRVFVEHPAAIALGMAAWLSHLVSQHKMSWLFAVHKLLKLCLELCGTFSCDPYDPINGAATYGIEPAMQSSDLTGVLEACGGARGAKLMRTATPLVFERSGSPAESLAGTGLFAPNAFGGHELGDYDANVPLDLTPAQSDVTTCGVITPDFKMDRYRVAIERNGQVHEEGDNPLMDRARMADYQTIGWNAFTLWKDEVRNPDAFNRWVRRIVLVMTYYDGDEVMREYERRVGDKDFLARQRTMFEAFCPWLAKDGSSSEKASIVGRAVTRE